MSEIPNVIALLRNQIDKINKRIKKLEQAVSQDTGDTEVKIASFPVCTRDEFIRRAQLKYPFLTRENISKLILRKHIKPIRRDGCYLAFDEQCWNDLEFFIKNRSRTKTVKGV